MESSVVSFLNRKSSATGELLFRRQKVVSYDVLVSLIGKKKEGSMVIQL
jgi:hypothetical protein